MIMFEASSEYIFLQAVKMIGLETKILRLDRFSLFVVPATYAIVVALFFASQA